MGDTICGLSLTPVRRSSELNCVTGKEPVWLEYEPIETGLILLQKMLAKGMLQQKQLMQCPPARVDLGISASAALRIRCECMRS